MDEALAARAQQFGIALTYTDVHGTPHAASEATVVALLQAMGVGADGREDTAAPVPPVVLVREGDAGAAVRVQLPASPLPAALRWRIEEEHGGVRRGECRPADLPAAAPERPGGCASTGRRLPLPGDLPAGYHRLVVEAAGVPAAQGLLIVAPQRAYLPRAIEGDRRVWGVTAQLYALRSARNWGMGDFTDLTALVESLGLRGAAVVGLNPLHALFAHDPQRRSPYSPSSRRFLNTLYLDVEAIDDFREDEATRQHVRCAAFQARLLALRASAEVDHIGVAAAKHEVLGRLFAHFQAHHLALDTDRARAFKAWCGAQGQALERYAVFEALQSHFGGTAWPHWPEAFRQPGSPAVARFAGEHADRIAQTCYLQWQAALQLGTAARRADQLGLGVGLMADLAVSVDPAGADAWAQQALFALQARVGAPPDELNPQGQDWGLPPWQPEALRAQGYAPYIALLRANMRHAGALRIDHVMGLMRLFWIPAGRPAAEGAYVHYRLDEMLGILALESQRHGCAVIGEDLGTVPEGLRDTLAAAGVLSTRLLLLERDAQGHFKPPCAWPRQALAAVATHDLPPLAGWWAGADLAVRRALGLYPTEAARAQEAVGRAANRARLLLALEQQALLPPDAAIQPGLTPALSVPLAAAVHRHLARTPCAIVVAQLEDLTGMVDAVNLPGTVDEHPNWRRKLPCTLESLARHAGFNALTQALAAERSARSGAAACHVCTQTRHADARRHATPRTRRTTPNVTATGSASTP